MRRDLANVAAFLSAGGAAVIAGFLHDGGAADIAGFLHDRGAADFAGFLHDGDGHSPRILRTIRVADVLSRQIKDIADAAGASSVALSYYDYATATSWSYHGDRWFHAASTIKVAVLLGLFAGVEKQRFKLTDRLHVRNRFFSLGDRSVFRISSGSDSNEQVHRATGKLMRLRELAEHMICTSSNLATNLLLDLVGVEFVNETMVNCGVRGVDLRRGVEDEKAFEAGINNRITSDGLVSLFRLIEDRSSFGEEACEEMISILRKQEFRSGIPAGVPGEIRTETQFAHKTGDISTVTHDAGIVYLPDRSPYVLAILTEWQPDASGRRETIAQLSRIVFEYLTENQVENA